MMNKCFFIGKVIRISNFKFILNSKEQHKSKVSMIVKLLDSNYIKVVAYDEVADYVIRKNYNNNLVCIQGKIAPVKNGVQAIIKYIEQI